MAKIEIREPEGPYSCVLDTEAMQVELREVFLGVRFITESGEELTVSMRDSGFEIRYFSEPENVEKPYGVAGIELKNGSVDVCRH